MTMRLGVDARELDGGVRTGIGRYVVEVLRAACDAGWECDVYGTRRTTLPPSLPALPVRTLRAPATLWWDQITLARRLKEDRVSVFLSPYYKTPLWCPCPVVVTIHDLYFIGYPGRRQPWRDRARATMARLYARRAAAIITDSEFSKRAILDRLSVPPEAITVIPLAPDPMFRPQPPGDDVLARYGITRPYILAVGNFKPHKNLAALVAAYARLDPAVQRRHLLVLAGERDEQTARLSAEIRRLGLPERVRCPGLVADRDLPALYSGASLFVLPSLVEGFGLPALEAMRCGTPVAASNRAAIPEVVGDAGALFDPEDVGAMASLLTELLTRRELADELRRRGQARARLFSRERTAGRVLELLARVAGGARTGEATRAARSAGAGGPAW